MDTFFIDEMLYHQRPTNPNGRLAKEMRTYDKLDQLGISYLRLDHSPTATIKDCHDVDQRLGITICKNLFLCNSQQTQFYLLMMPGNKKFKTATITKQLNCARLSFATPEYMEKFLDITPGSVSVLGLMNDHLNQVRLLIDQDIISGHPYIGCHPCINTSSLKIKTTDLLDLFLPAVQHSYTAVELPV